MSNELLLSILAYVFNSILLSSFIIPQVQKLKEIKDKLVKFQMTFVPNAGSVQDINACEEKQEDEIKQFQDLLDIYALRSCELRDLVYYFRIAIGIVILAILSVVKWPQSTNLILVMHTLSQIAIFFIALRVYAVSPDRMQDIGYLVNRLDINPHILVNALDLKLYIDAKGGLLARRVKREEPLIISAFPKIRVWGFRFLLIIANEQNRVFFVSFGPITSGTQIVRHLTPFQQFGMGEFNRIELGRFPFNMIKEKQELKIFFLFFLPFYRGDTYNPYLTEGHYWAEGVASPNINIGSGTGTPSISTTVSYEDIEYQGVGVNIKTSVKLDAKSHVVNDVFKKYAREFERTKKIKQYQEIDGGLI